MGIRSEATRIWTTEDNKRQMQVSDDAFIGKDIGRFNHADDAKIHMPGGVEMDMVAHVADIVNIFAAFPDLRPHNHDYKIVFAEGEWTFAVADVTATNTGPIRGPAGAYVPPTNKKVAFELCTAARWVQGEMVEEYIWTDAFRMLRQLGFAGPPVGIEVPPTLEMNAATPLRSGMGDLSEQNKHLMKESDDALNAGTFNAQDLHLAEGITVYGTSEAPTGAEGYLRDAERVREAYSDLHLYNDPYRVIVAEGDWTGTVARLTGTQTGPIRSPEGMDMPTIPPTNRAFDVNHFTIARWQNGEIVQLKILFDFVGVLHQLGLG